MPEDTDQTERKNVDRVLRVLEKLYFDDGNILLDILSGESRWRCRVHKSVLARASTFFADMFRVPQPTGESSTGPLVDGCPIIELTGDEIDDWCIVINALYSPSFNQTQQPVENIIAMLRIGKKYDFQWFLQDAKFRLRQSYPRNLKQFRKRNDTRSIRLRNISRLLEVIHEGILPDDVLPALYYENLRDINKLHDPDKEGTADLSDSLKLRLMVGYRRLIHAQATHTYGYLQKRIALNCQEPTQCKPAFVALCHSLDTPRYQGNIPLQPFEQFSDVLPANVNFCRVCRSHFTQKTKAGARKVWDMLPGCFGLGTWGDLGEPEGERETRPLVFYCQTD